MDINWSKTFFMIVTAKHKSKMMIPTSIEIDSHEVAVTDSFKLLGVLIDNDLTFNQHIVQHKKTCIFAICCQITVL